MFTSIDILNDKESKLLIEITTIKTYPAIAVSVKFKDKRAKAKRKAIIWAVRGIDRLELAKGGNLIQLVLVPSVSNVGNLMPIILQMITLIRLRTRIPIATLK